MQNNPGFFQHHGVWAFGVRLFRRIHFKAKAGIVTVTFLIPIVALGWSFYNDKAASIEFSAKERLGVEYIRDIMPLLKTAVAHRAAASAESSGLIDTQLKKLAATEASLGVALGTEKQFARVNEARAKMSGAGAKFDADTVFIAALQDLLTQANDGSNLILDPDLDTYYLMDTSTTRVPQLIELIARTRASVAGGDAAATQHSLADRLPLIEYHEEQLKIGLSKSTGATPGLTASLKAEGPSEELRAFIALARSTYGAAPFDAAARKAIDGQFALSTRLLDDLDRLIEVRISGMKSVRNLTTAIVVASLTAAAYLFYCFFLVTRGGMQEVQRHLEVMTRGDLTSTPRPWGQDEAAELMEKLLAMQDSLARIVKTVRGSSEQMVQASSEIAAASTDLSSRTEQTASSLEQSAASMEQISATIKHTAENAREAADVAESNSGVAERGGQVIGEVVSTMQEIHASSSKISDIIGVIDGIAFQTNILALNAAVEAARAGEQGRGFAVVAGEVRALAQRSAQAAKEIKELISSSVGRVEAGTRVVEGAGITMRELVSNAKRMTHLLNEISVAAREESSGVTQVGTAVQELDRVTQQNAALVEQTAASASALKDRAATLAAEVAKFKLP